MRAYGCLQSRPCGLIRFPVPWCTFQTDKKNKSMHSHKCLQEAALFASSSMWWRWITRQRLPVTFFLTPNFVCVAGRTRQKIKLGSFCRRTWNWIFESAAGKLLAGLGGCWWIRAHPSTHCMVLLLRIVVVSLLRVASCGSMSLQYDNASEIRKVCLND